MTFLHQISTGIQRYPESKSPHCLGVYFHSSWLGCETSYQCHPGIYIFSPAAHCYLHIFICNYGTTRDVKKVKRDCWRCSIWPYGFSMTIFFFCKTVTIPNFRSVYGARTAAYSTWLLKWQLDSEINKPKIFTSVCFSLNTDENRCRRVCCVWSEARQVKHEGTCSVFCLYQHTQFVRLVHQDLYIQCPLMPRHLSDDAHLLGRRGRDDNILWVEHKENEGDKWFEEKSGGCFKLFASL